MSSKAGSAGSGRAAGGVSGAGDTRRLGGAWRTPGFIRSEAMLQLFGVSEANWRDGMATDPHFAFSETPLYLARAVAALASDEGVVRGCGRDGSGLERACPGGGLRGEQAASQQRFLAGFVR